MIICSDPGHGGSDNGAVYGYAEEDDYNLIICYLLRYELQKKKAVVILTRERDVYVPLQRRCDIANDANADLFISIHCDAWHKRTVKGISTHIHPQAGQETRKAAGRIHNALIETFPEHTNRGLKEDDFYVLRHTKMPALLVECEFISNPEMRDFLKEPENQLDIAKTISDAIML